MRLVTLPLVGRHLASAVLQASEVDEVRAAWRTLGHPEATVAALPDAFAAAWYRMDHVPHSTRSWVGLLRRAVRLRGARPEAALTPADLRRVRSPVLLVWGRADPFGPVELGRRGASSLPDATFHAVGVGHLPWLDDPVACGELVDAFLDRHG